MRSDGVGQHYAFHDRANGARHTIAELVDGVRRGFGALAAQRDRLDLHGARGLHRLIEGAAHLPNA